MDKGFIVKENFHPFEKESTSFINKIKEGIINKLRDYSKIEVAFVIKFDNFNYYLRITLIKVTINELYY
jgi:hypothetical protein